MQIETPPEIRQTAQQVAFGQTTFNELKCATCHIVGAIATDQETSNLAPDFRLAKNRLRYEWFDDWLRNPQQLLPGTRMPDFFYYEGKPTYPDADDRIRAVTDYIYQLKQN
jgi:cytochrome c2